MQGYKIFDYLVCLNMSSLFHKVAINTDLGQYANEKERVEQERKGMMQQIDQLLSVEDMHKKHLMVL